MKKRIMIVALGGLAGFTYYYFIGCNNGMCLIQSNPYLSSTYGAAVGWALSTIIIPAKKDPEENGSSTNP